MTGHNCLFYSTNSGVNNVSSLPFLLKPLPSSPDSGSHSGLQRVHHTTAQHSTAQHTNFLNVFQQPNSRSVGVGNYMWLIVFHHFTARLLHTCWRWQRHNERHAQKQRQAYSTHLETDSCHRTRVLVGSIFIYNHLTRPYRRMETAYWVSDNALKLMQSMFHLQLSRSRVCTLGDGTVHRYRFINVSSSSRQCCWCHWYHK